MVTDAICAGAALRARQRLFFILALAVALCVSGCGSLNALDAAVDYERKFVAGADKMVVTHAPSTQPAAEGASQFAAMALFSHMAYLKHLAIDQRNERECWKHVANHPVSEIDARDPGVIPAWRRWEDKAGCFSGGGLYFEVYVFGTKDKYEEAVIAFRGTENHGVQGPLDWSSNFAAALGLDPAEYRLAREQVANTLLALLPRLSGDKKIYLTGHSLGGGLAQQSAYVTPSEIVKETYVFNTSPVSNWAYLYPERIVTDDPVIYRVQERGEGLALVRWFTSRANFRRFGRSDYEFNFSLSNPVDSHGMAVLACNFASLVLATGKGGDKHFTLEMARNVLAHKAMPGVAGSERLCPDGVWGG